MGARPHLASAISRYTLQGAEVDGVLRLNLGSSGGGSPASCIRCGRLRLPTRTCAASACASLTESPRVRGISRVATRRVCASVPPSTASVWPVGLREPLPEIPIPLAGDDPDVWLDLKPILDAVYDGGAYRYRLYDSPPDPPLLGDDAAWATALEGVG